MDKILKAIIANLNKKGLSSQEFPAFIRDACRSIDYHHDGKPDISYINHRLRNLGWTDISIDQYLFDLLMFLHERSWEGSVEKLAPLRQMELSCNRLSFSC